MEDREETANQYPCSQCGAELKWHPGSQALACPYCGHENVIEIPPTTIEELDFEHWLKQAESQAPQVQVNQIRCEPCGALVELPSTQTAALCPFCGSPFTGTALAKTHLKPQGLLPFSISGAQASTNFHAWVRKLWFAPNALRHMNGHDHLKGVYTPYWTFDSKTSTRFEGMRGDDYYETETSTQTVNGKSKRVTRRVRKTRWSRRSGQVEVAFDDILVLASESLPRKLSISLEPWPLEQVVPYGEAYLSGFLAESYQVPLGRGFEHAQERMEPLIRQAICNRIGGDRQRILWLSTQHRDVTFKHLLLPVWVSAFRFRGKLYRFMVNALTGRVAGQRPWSIIKIAAAVAGVLAVLGTVLWLNR